MVNNRVPSLDSQFHAFSDFIAKKRESKIFLKYWIILHMFDIKENVVFQNEKADLISTYV